MKRLIKTSFVFYALLIGTYCRPENVKLGSQCVLKHVKSGLFLAGSNFPSKIVDPKNTGEFYCHTGVYMAQEPYFDSLWVIKKEHLDNERWNFTEQELLKNNATLRLENSSTGGNLFPSSDEKSITPKTGYKINFGIGSLSNDSNLKVVVVKIGAKEVRPDEVITGSTVVYLSFSLEGKVDLVLLYDGVKQELFFKPMKDCQAQDLLNAQWYFDVAKVDYFKLSYFKPLEALLKIFDDNQKFKQLQSRSVYNVSAMLIPGVKDESFMFSEIRLPDQDAYLGLINPEAKKTNKVSTRMHQICMQNSNSAWGVSNTFKVVKFDFAQDKTFTELVIDKLADQVGCSSDKLFVRIGKDVFLCSEFDDKKAALKLAKDPVATDVIDFSVASNGDLFFIDAKYSIFKKSSDKKAEKVYQYNQSIYPPFSRISVDQSGKRLLATTSDGKLFLFDSDYKKCIFTGIEFCLNACLIGDRVVFACQNVGLQGGSCFYINLQDLLKIGGNNYFLNRFDCKSLQALVEVVKYCLGLFFKDEQSVGELVLWLEKRVEDFIKDKNSKAGKEFLQYFKAEFLPSVNLLQLNSQVKSSLSKIETFFADKIVTDGDLKAKVESLEKENKALKESLKRASQLMKVK